MILFMAFIDVLGVASILPFVTVLTNPDLIYNQLIRPWKSRLGLIYIQNQSFLLDLKIIIYTLIAIISKQSALNWVSSQLELMDVDSNVVNVSKRKVELYPFPPPGMDKVITGK